VSTRGKGSSNIRDPAKEVSVETSMRYMKSTGKYLLVFLPFILYLISHNNHFPILISRVQGDIWRQQSLGLVSKEFQGSVCTKNSEVLFCKYTYDPIVVSNLNY